MRKKLFFNSLLLIFALGLVLGWQGIAQALGAPPPEIHGVDREKGLLYVSWYEQDQKQKEAGNPGISELRFGEVIDSEGSVEKWITYTVNDRSYSTKYNGTVVYVAKGLVADKIYRVEVRGFSKEYNDIVPSEPAYVSTYQLSTYPPYVAYITDKHAYVYWGSYSNVSEYWLYYRKAAYNYLAPRISTGTVTGYYLGDGDEGSLTANTQYYVSFAALRNNYAQGRAGPLNGVFEQSGERSFWTATTTTTTTTTTLGNAYWRIRIINKDDDNFTYTSPAVPVYYQIKNETSNNWTDQYAVEVPRYSTIYTPAWQVYPPGEYRSLIQWYDPDLGKWSSHFDASAIYLPAGTTTYFEKTIPFGTTTTTSTTITLPAPVVKQVSATAVQVSWPAAYEIAYAEKIPLEILSYRIHADLYWNNIDGMGGVTKYVLEKLNPGTTYDVKVGNPKISPPLWTGITWFTVSTTTTTTTTTIPSKPPAPQVLYNPYSSVRTAYVWWQDYGASSYTLHYMVDNLVHLGEVEVSASLYKQNGDILYNLGEHAAEGELWAKLELPVYTYTVWYSFTKDGVDYVSDFATFQTALAPKNASYNILVINQQPYNISVTWSLRRDNGELYVLGYNKPVGAKAYAYIPGPSASDYFKNSIQGGNYKSTISWKDDKGIMKSQEYSNFINIPVGGEFSFTHTVSTTTTTTTTTIPISIGIIRVVNADNDTIDVNWEVYSDQLKQVPGTTMFEYTLVKSGKILGVAPDPESVGVKQTFKVPSNRQYRTRIWWYDPDAPGTVFESDDADFPDGGWRTLPEGEIIWNEAYHIFGHTIPKYPVTISSSITFKNEDDDYLDVGYLLTKYADQTTTIGLNVLKSVITVPPAAKDGTPGEAKVPNFTAIDPGWYVLTCEWTDPDMKTEVQKASYPIRGRLDATTDPLGFGRHFLIVLPRVVGPTGVVTIVVPNILDPYVGDLFSLPTYTPTTFTLPDNSILYDTAPTTTTTVPLPVKPAGESASKLESGQYILELSPTSGGAK